VDKKGKIDPYAASGANYWYTIPNHTVRNFMNNLAEKATPSGQLRLGGARLDFLGGRKHDGRDRPRLACKNELRALTE
jgi:hypothetical protein